MTPRWTTYEKSRFLLSYFFYKFLAPFEVRHDRLRIFIFEWRDFIQNLTNHFRRPPKFDLQWRGNDQIITRFGTYAVRRGTQDVTVISPAFERLDMNRMLDWVDELSRNGQRFTFLDIGANIGRYAVAVENRAGQSVEIHAFEPDLTNFVLLKKNIKGITSRLHPIGLSDAPGEANLRVNALRPWDQGLGDALGTTVTLDTLDHCLAGNSKISLENLLIKMDVDGHELSVLAGAREVLKSSANVRLLIEDVCDRNAIYQKLEEIGFRPLCKLTPYNSWWEKGGPRAIPIDQSAKQR